MKEAILSQLPAGCPWRGSLIWHESTDSTNTQAKLLAHNGAPHGTVVIAGSQTGGRGRMGRSFASPAGAGVYLSVILRPGVVPTRLMHLTCATAVAVCDAVETCAGFRPGIKWINDLVYHRKKLGGILTELSIDSGTGLLDYAVVGIGINCLQTAEDFPDEIGNMAISASMAAGRRISPALLAASMIEALVQMDAQLLSGKAAIMERYQHDCITIGQDVAVIRGEERRYGKALAVEADGGLLVAFQDGTTQAVSSGEVSVRGMYGYV